MEEKEADLKAKVISIGPSTTETAKELGLPIWKTAAEYTSEGMAAVILADNIGGK